MQIVNCGPINLQSAFCNLHFAISIIMVASAAATTILETVAPTTSADVAAAVRAAHDARQPVYPRGGCTAQDYGIPPTREGVGLDLTGLARIVDYTPRDMTVLVESGVRMAELAAKLAAEGQQLPIDVPRAGEATIGGVVATNWTGPRRYGYGTIRDYVIGIYAVDGRGTAFKGGGRVVKNVAGYDFCKLLTGSLGTLAVITQLALKLKPLPEHSVCVAAACRNLAVAEEILAGIVKLAAPPTSIDLLVGSQWRVPIPGWTTSSVATSPFLIVRVEGTELEAAWLAEEIVRQMAQGGATGCKLAASDADTLWSKQVEFADRGPGDANDNSPLVVKICVPPSRVTHAIGELLGFDPDCTVQSHAGSGIIVARFSQFSHADVGKVLLGKLRPAAIQQSGSLILLKTSLEGLTPHAIWGGRTDATVLMERIKQKFDPHNILNPNRFVF
jgi:glycolate oxidase FAD binding subunit